MAGALPEGGGTAAVSPGGGGHGAWGDWQDPELACKWVHRYGQYIAGGVFWVNCTERAAGATKG
jgi:hypothetical protein